jgi:hypothetical protein
MSCTYNPNDRTLICENIDLTTIPQMLNEKPTDIIENFGVKTNQQCNTYVGSTDSSQCASDAYGRYFIDEAEWPYNISNGSACISCQNGCQPGMKTSIIHSPHVRYNACFCAQTKCKNPPK